MTGSAQRRSDIIDALRIGAVPARGLDTLAVGLERFESALLEELERVRAGHGVFKALRGEYGGGKTFFARWLEERGRRLGFATAEVQISETETPLHKLETVYRRLAERLSTSSVHTGALRSVIDGWFFTLEEDVLASGHSAGPDLLAATGELMERRLAAIHRIAPSFTAALRAYRTATAGKDPAAADALLGWLGGQPNVSAALIRQAGIKGAIDHFGALSFLLGLLVILRDGGHAGLIVVLLNALRQLIDEVHAGRFPGLYLLITGTPAFFDGPQGVRRLPPLAGRLHVDFSPDDQWDNPRAPQIRLRPFTIESLTEVGTRVRDLYAAGSQSARRIASHCDNAYLRDLAAAVAGGLGGKVGIAPRLYLKKLVTDVLDRIDQFPGFDPRRHYTLTLSTAELNDVERSAAVSVDDIDLPL